MGYFPNGTAGEMYQEAYCDRCLNDANGDCPIWLAHLFYNDDERDNPDSILHLLIPRSKDGLGNEQCTMFMPRVPEERVQLVDLVNPLACRERGQ